MDHGFGNSGSSNWKPGHSRSCMVSIPLPCFSLPSASVAFLLQPGFLYYCQKLAPANFSVAHLLGLGREGQLYKHGYFCYSLAWLWRWGGFLKKGGLSRHPTECPLHSSPTGLLPMTPGHTHTPSQCTLTLHTPTSQPSFSLSMVFQGCLGLTIYLCYLKRQIVPACAEGTQSPNMPASLSRGEGGSSEGMGSPTITVLGSG